MIPAVDIQPRGLHGLARETVHLDPSKGSIIKQEEDAFVWRQKLADGTPAVIKMYFNRKMLWLKKTRFYTGRAEREFRILCHAHAHHIGCSPPLFWAIGKTNEGRTYELLATREIPDACDLRKWITDHYNKASLDLAPLFDLVARLHRAGIMHGALLARNILIADGHFLLIDLPRSQQFGRSIEGRAAGMFDIELLIANLTRHMDDQRLTAGLTGYPSLPRPAADIVKKARHRPIRKYARLALRDFFLLQSAWSRWFSAADAKSTRQ